MARPRLVTRPVQDHGLRCPAPLRADALSRRQQVVIYGVLTLSSFAYNYSFILIDYIRPFLMRELGMSLADTAILYAAQGAGVIIGSFTIPMLVSRFGSRPLVVASSGVLALLTLGSLFTRSYEWWAVLRLGVGVTLAGCYVSATTMLANFFPPRVRGRLLAVNMAMFSVALFSAGSVGVAVGEGGWKSLIWLAVASAVAVAGIAAWLLPSDRHYAVYADEDDSGTPNAEQGSWKEMLSGRRLSLTVRCLLIAGLNFSGYQFYSGFITTYLLNVRHFDASITGSFVMIDGIGTLLGSILWGWVADRQGRRANALGFGATALFIALFLVAPRNRVLLYPLELGYAICLSAAYCWAAYFAELFPVRLRPMGTALFHGGHVISLLAPLLVATVAQSLGLAFGMALAPATFIIAALIWWTLPETLRSSPRYRGFVPDDIGTPAAAHR